MTWLFVGLLSIISGVVAGMGMGGGTLLIPFLTIILNIPQKVAQITNLLGFVPMATLTLIIYIKKKMIDFSYSWIIIVSAALLSFIGALLMFGATSKLLKICFGFFIAGIGLFTFIQQLCKKSK